MSDKLTLTAQLREKMISRLGKCPTCGHARWSTLRDLAKKIGVSPATLSRWLNGGKLPDSTTIDKTWSYFARSVRSKKP